MNLQTFLPRVTAYLAEADLGQVPGWHSDIPPTITPLAQGEYNMNYCVQQAGRTWVFRVNIGTQISPADATKASYKDEAFSQIRYEYRALKLLASTGVTPRPFYVDTKGIRDDEGETYGVLLMAYLSGEPLDYSRDLTKAARLFARVHSQPVAPEDNHLIPETRPLSMTYEECSRLLPIYLDSELAEPALRDYLREVLAWAGEARHREAYFLDAPWPCIINTEVNSGNFIVNRARDTIHLVDWEKPLWGDPSQDLSHFCVPTTTLWKTDYRMTTEDRRAFLDAYREAVLDAHLRDTIADRVRLRDPFNCLRGISWSAMAWVTYQTGEHALKNEDTFRKVSAYLDLAFVRSLFDPYMGR
jgi:aminoglycoside phosphotransferase (APT) family kinase protein